MRHATGKYKWVKAKKAQPVLSEDDLPKRSSTKPKRHFLKRSFSDCEEDNTYSPETETEIETEATHRPPRSYVSPPRKRRMSRPTRLFGEQDIEETNESEEKAATMEPIYASLAYTPPVTRSKTRIFPKRPLLSVPEEETVISDEEMGVTIATLASLRSTSPPLPACSALLEPIGPIAAVNIAVEPDAFRCAPTIWWPAQFNFIQNSYPAASRT